MIFSQCLNLQYWTNMYVSFRFSHVQANVLYRPKMKRFLSVKKKLLALSATDPSQFMILMAILMSLHQNFMYVSKFLPVSMIIHIISFSMLSLMTGSKSLWNLLQVLWVYEEWLVYYPRSRGFFQHSNAEIWLSPTKMISSHGWTPCSPRRIF